MNLAFFAHNIIMKNQNIIDIHQLSLPISFENIIPDDDSVRLLFNVTEGLNYTELYNTYSTNGRNPVILPETMFRIIVYGYMEGIYSSRDLAKACRRDINFKWLLQGQKPPTHNSIARFRSNKLLTCIDNLFNQLVAKLADLNEIKFENIFIDGTKIEANANRYTFVWKNSVEKNEHKLQEKTLKLLDTISQEFKLNYSNIDKVSIDVVNEVLTHLNSLKSANNIEFVHGKGKRKSSLQKYIEVLYEYIEKQSKYNEYNLIFNGRNSFSKTDHDATFMRMKEDHMKNGQLKPAYNIQIGVEAEYIVGVDLSSERADQLTFIPFLEKLEKGLGVKYESVVADAGYESEENYTHLEKNNQQAYIKPSSYEKAKTSKYKNDISKVENMTYIDSKDFYICAAGKRLLFKGTLNKKSKSGFVSVKRIYECEDCTGCALKDKCTKAKGNKQLQVAQEFLRLRKNSLKNITSPKGVILRINRSIQVEGAFGVIKQDYGFRRFLTRSNNKVYIEFLLMAFGYNINKLHNKTIQNRAGQLLHKTDS